MSDDLVCFLINAINIRTDFEKCHDFFLEKERSVSQVTRFFLFDSMDSHQFTAFMFFLLGSILTAAIGNAIWLASENQKLYKNRSMSIVSYNALPIEFRKTPFFALQYFENQKATRESFEINERDLIKSNSILGRGNFGEVFKWILRRDDILMEVAVKRKFSRQIFNNSSFFGCRIYTYEQRYLVAKELEIMCMLGRHPNIIGFMGAVTVNPRSTLLVLEYADCGNLLEFLRVRREIFKNQIISENDENGNFSKQRKMYSFIEHPAIISNDLDTLDLVSYAFQIANGMKYLASIMDFDANIMTKFSEKTDIWSFGVCLYELFTLGDRPYENVDHVSKFLDSGKRLSEPEYCPTEIYELMKMCWDRDPMLRPNFAMCAEMLKDQLRGLSEQAYHELQNKLGEVEQEQEKLECSIRK